MMSAKRTCPKCHGAGSETITLRSRCPTCWGEGRTVRRHCPNCDLDFELFIPQPCPSCGRDFNDDESANPI